MPITNMHEGLTINGLLPHVDANPEDFFDIENSKFLYTRGFLMCKKQGVKINSHFSELAVGNGYFLYYHELLKPTISSDSTSGVCVILLGTAYFTNINYIDTNKTEADILLEKLMISENVFYKSLDYLAGRYAIICMVRKNVFVVNDPCGLRTVFYNSDSDCIGSHLELLNSFAQRRLSSIENDIMENGYKIMYAYPGNCTKYDNIFFLIPDFYLNLSTYTMKRFFPHDKIEKTTNVLEVKRRYFEKMDLSVSQVIKKGKKICFSLTGGMDSRVSFYTTQKYKDKIFYFTESRDKDIEVSNKLAMENRLNWIGADSKDIKLKNNLYVNYYYDILKTNIFPKSSMLALQNMFWNLNLFLTADEYIHIHSNCAEAGRGRTEEIEMPFESSTYCFERFFDTYIKSTYCWQDKRLQEEQYMKMCSDELLCETLKSFFDMLNLEHCASLEYNPWDLMYIEQRTSAFLSQVHMLNDALYDSISLTNSREILNLMWMLPEEYISTKCILYKCILNELDMAERNTYMGSSFAPTNSEEETKNYHLIYAGYALVNSKSIEEKVSMAEKVLKINQTVKWAHKQLIEGYIKMGKSEKAAKDWELVNAYDPKLAREFTYCGDGICNGLRQLNKNKSARLLIDYALQKNSECSWAYKQLSHITDSEGKVWDALSLAEKSFAFNRDDRWVAQNYIMLLLKAEQFDKANKVVFDAVKRNKDKFWPNHCCAICLFYKGNYKKALEYSYAALKINPSDKEATYWNKRILDMIK